jgi:hypothetical protein
MITSLTDNLGFVADLRSRMSDHCIMLSYRGEISQDIVIALLNLAENKLTRSTPDLNIKSRVFSVMIECLQNITQHSEKNDHLNSNIFMIGHAEDSYTIFSGNVMKSEKVETLREKLVKINFMSEEELREFYKYLIKIETLSGKTGSGLGLIQIARKTGKPLEFDFKKLDEEYSFFSLRTIIDHKNNF